MLKQEFYQNQDPNKKQEVNPIDFKKTIENNTLIYDSKFFPIDEYISDFYKKYIKKLYEPKEKKDRKNWISQNPYDLEDNFKRGMNEIERQFMYLDDNKTKKAWVEADDEISTKICRAIQVLSIHTTRTMGEIVEDVFNKKNDHKQCTSNYRDALKILEYFLNQMQRGYYNYNETFNFFKASMEKDDYFNSIGISPYHVLVEGTSELIAHIISEGQKENCQNNKLFEAINFNNKKIIDTFIRAACSLDEIPDKFVSGDISKILNLDRKYSIEMILSKIKNASFSDPYILIICLTDLIGAENARQELNLMIEQNNSTSKYSSHISMVRNIITPNYDKIAIENLQKFYQENIKFEDYKINQEMNDGEVELLQGLIGKDEKVLEEGCGTGRLLLEMKKAGYDAVGIDFTSRHTNIIKEKNPETKVLQGDWHKIGFKDKSFDTVYSLGRNILHDYSIVDQAQLFHEANRILKPNGKFIFDIPNRKKGGYKKMVDEYGNEMKKRGIKNFRQGTIYDSPDGINFATRYAYSEDDIKTLAQMTGFKINEVRKKELATGQKDENLYFVLEKI